MAIQFPEGIYTEWQGTFNALPYAKMVEARKKAKDEAFNKYYDKLRTQINTAGVRQQDILDPVTGKGIETDIRNMASYGIQNRDAVMKGGVERLELERMQREILNNIQRSKNIGKTQDDIAKLKFENKLELDEDDLLTLDQMNASIYNPKHFKESRIDPNYNEIGGTQFGLGDFSAMTPSLNEKEKSSIWKFGIQNEAMQIDPTTEERIGYKTYYKKKYTDETLKRGADRIMNLPIPQSESLNDRKIRKTYNYLKDNTAWMAEAGPIFEKFYGKPIETVNDAAAADFLLNMSKAVSEPEEQKIPSRVSGRRGGAGGEYKMWDAYSELYPILQKGVQGFVSGAGGKLYNPINNLGSDIYNLLVTQLEKIELKDNIKYPKNEAYVAIEPDKTIGLYVINKKTGKEKLITVLNERGLNRLANPGQKGFTAVEKKIESKGTKTKASAAKYPLPKGKPRTVKQGNFTYTWNENTGQYE